MRNAVIIAILGVCLHSTGPVSLPAVAQEAEPASSHSVDWETMRGEEVPPEAIPEHGYEPCVGGLAGPYPCQRVDLLTHLDLASIGGGQGNDIWGWTDPLTSKEYAIMGRTNGTAFVDITTPTAPVYLGNLPSHSGTSSWRDIKVYANHAFIVSDFNGAHGMQVFDLTQLRSVVSPPATFAETAHYGQFGSAHNIVINEQTGFAYAVGSNCSGGLHMIDIRTPATPVFAGCYSGDGYTHDAQCVVYQGPDTEHQGSEICFNSNEDTLTLVDVSDKTTPVLLARKPYAGARYTHQGWLTEDHAFFLLDDELDESNNGHNTRTYIWDVSDLDDPIVIGTYTAPVAATDHNQYVRGQFTFQANYKSGLRILNLESVATGVLSEMAYFDIFPSSDTTGYSGAWSVYPFFDSGVVVVSGIEQGLFILEPQLCTQPAAPFGLSAIPAGDQRIDLEWSHSGGPEDTFDVFRSLGSCPSSGYERIAAGLSGTSFSDIGVSGQLEYAYVVTARDVSGICESAPSNCASAVTSGPCTAPPSFAGLGSVLNPGEANCALELGWSAASANCGSSVSYSVYRSTAPDFLPGTGNRIVDQLTQQSFVDVDVSSGETYYYIVRATDEGNGAEDSNLMRRSGSPTGPPADGTWSAGAEVGDPAMVLDSSPFGGLVAPEHVGWEPSEARQRSGLRSYFSTYADGQCTAMATPPIELTPGELSQLSFWTVYDIESRWDGGVVEISADGGTTWALLPLSPPYPSTFNTGGDACGYPSGHPAFTGTNLGWTRYSADLSALAGQQVQVRWVFSTDGSVTREGWYVDDIALTHAQVPGPCSGGPIFSDGFESGDTSAWSDPVP